MRDAAMGSECAVTVDYRSMKAQRIARVAIRQIRRLGYGKGEILELILSAVAANLPDESEGSERSQSVQEDHLKQAQVRA